MARGGGLVRGRLASLALSLWALCAAPGAAEELRLTLDEARASAAQMLQDGNPEAALILAEGVLLGDPDDYEAHLLKSRALRDLGRNKAAKEAAQTAWQLSETDRERYFAALVRAQAQSSDGQMLPAQFWLRRAAEIAPDEVLRNVAIRDFRHVRRMTPWRVALRFDAAPSSNVNGAPKSNSFVLGGLRFFSPTAVPMEGMRSTAGMDYRYMIMLGDRSRLHLGFGVERERVQFTSAAKAKVPGVRASDYARDDLDLRLGYEVIGPDARWLARADLTLGRDWVAHDVLADNVRLQLSYGRAVAPGLEATGHVAVESERRYDSALRDSTAREVGLSLTQSLENGAKLGFSVLGRNVESDSAGVAHDALQFGMSFGLAKPVWGTLPRLSVSYLEEDFDRPLFGPVARQDATWEVSVDLLLPNLDYYGFAPEIGLSFSDRQSNYSLFESETTDLRLGLRSLF